MNVHLRLWLRRLLDQLVMVYAGPFTSVSVTGDGNKNVKEEYLGKAGDPARASSLPPRRWPAGVVLLTFRV